MLNPKLINNQAESHYKLLQTTQNKHKPQQRTKGGPYSTKEIAGLFCKNIYSRINSTIHTRN